MKALNISVPITGNSKFSYTLANIFMCKPVVIYEL